MRIYLRCFVFCGLLCQYTLATVPPVSGSVPVHLRPHLAKIQSEYQSGYWAERFARRAELMKKGILNRSMQAIDTVNVPVLMGEYSNSTGKHSPQVFQELLFDGPNATGTLTQFYLENSYNQLFMTGKALGWFPTTRTFDYYVHDGGSNNAGLVYGGRDFTIDVLVEADKTVDFSKYVKYSDADGPHVPYVAIIHTGGDAAAGADNIWSHRWNIRGRLNDRKNSGTETIVDVNRIRPDGKYITNDSLDGKPVIFDGDYAIQPEFIGNSNSAGNPKPIGVFTHEFGHIFGLPDLYDTDNSSAGLGNWCLMAGGSYGGDGSHEGTPAHMSAWCKVTLGWVTPTLITAYTPQQQIKNVEEHPEIFKLNVKNLAGGEYFLVENRQRVGYDTYLLGTGLLIYHIDPTRTSNSNENRRLVDLEQGDGLRQLNTGTARGDDGDPFPGSSNNRTFDGYSKPNSVNYSLQQSYVGIRNISSTDTVMTADLDVGTRPYIMVRTLAGTESGTNNGNGRIDAGETGTISVNVENIYPTALSNGSLRVTSTTADVTVDTSQKLFSVNGLDTVSVQIEGVSVAQNAEPRKVGFTVTVTTPEETFQTMVTMFIGFPKIVLMNLDSVSSENIHVYYENAVLDNQKHSETVSAVASTMNNANLQYRDVAVLFSGRKTANIITDSLGAELTAFLNAGGKLFVSGQNIAEDLSKRGSLFAASLLHASWSKNVLIGRTLNGIPSDQFGSILTMFNVAGGNGAKNQTSPDELTVDTMQAHPSFRWNSTTNAAYGGVWWEDQVKGSKTVFWSFGLEAVNDSAVGGKSRQLAMKTVLDWFTGITSVPEYPSAGGLPQRYELAANYPNPFNPVTTIRYSLPKDGLVSLVVYDILGKEVASLVNEHRSAGVYAVPFDASRLSSGMYFYRLMSGKFAETKKMLLMK